MGYKLHDFECKNCGREWEDLIDVGTATIECQGCKEQVPPCLSVPKLGMFSMMDQTQTTESLKKRSREHTQKQIIDKSPEKWGAEGRRRRTKKIQVGYGR